MKALGSAFLIVVLRDYERACDLSVFDRRSDCLEVMKAKPFGDELELEGFSSRDGGEGTASISFGGKSNDGQMMSTGFADVGVERHGDQYKVHFEYSVIR